MASRRTLMAFLLGTAAISLTGLQGCSKAQNAWQGRGGPPRVVVSIPPLYSFVKKVGGDHVGVISLCTQTGPHHYDASPKDALALRDADLLIGIGLGLDEKFMDAARSSSGNPKLKYVKLTDSKRFDKARDIKKLEGEDDPHVWLGIDTAKKLVLAIADELKAVDGQHAADYDKNAAAYGAELDELQAEYRKTLKGKKDKVLPMHDSLQYFKDSFGLENVIEDAIELKPGDKPDAKRYADLVNKCLAEKIRFIAVEPQYEEKEAETLKKELNKELKKDNKKGIEAVIFTIDPLETADVKELEELGGEWYLKKMRQNLETLGDNLK
jgi:ABC-type Zn uptake system ZnuABC Zn-binding protein ZnuA